MKICFIGNNLSMMYRFRGETITSLVNKGYSVHIICPIKNSEIIFDKKVIIHDLSFKTRKISIFELINIIYKCRLLLKSIKPNLLISFSLKPIVISLFANLFLKTPLVAFFSGLGYVFTPKFKWKSLSNYFLKFIGYYASEIVVINDDDLELLSKVVNNCPVSLCPGEGINVKKFNAGDYNQKTIDFLYVGRLIDDKGFNLFLDAAVNLHADKDFIFACAGSGYGAKRIDILFKEKKLNKESFLYLGYVEDIVELISKSHYLVLPSMREGIPRSLLEAMSIGVICIGTDVPGIRQLIIHNETGFLINSPSVSLLTETFLDVHKLSNDEYRNMSNSAKRFILDNYSQEYVDNFYSNLIKKYDN